MAHLIFLSESILPLASNMMNISKIGVSRIFSFLLSRKICYCLIERLMFAFRGVDCYVSIVDCPNGNFHFTCDVEVLFNVQLNRPNIWDRRMF